MLAVGGSGDAEDQQTRRAFLSLSRLTPGGLCVGALCTGAVCPRAVVSLLVLPSLVPSPGC